MSMFDDLRDDSNSSPFFEEDKDLFEPEQEQPKAKGAARSKKGQGGSFQFIDKKGRILGMNAMQRFIIATMLLMVVCILGSMFMLVIGAFYLPI